MGMRAASDEKKEEEPKEKTVPKKLEKGWKSHSYDEKRYLNRPQILTVSQEEIAVVGPSGTTIRKWHTVTSVATTENHAFIYADIAFIVPRRPFLTQGKFDEFVNSIKQWSSKSESAT